jgi:hypothetical protein
MRTGIATVILLSFAVLVSHNAIADDQSLGDVARKQRLQQAKKTDPAAKVVTNEDIPEHPADPKDADEPKQGENDSKVAPSMSGAQVKAVIQAQKRRIAALQAQIDKLGSSIHYVEANRYRNGVEYNQAQQRKQQEVDRMQKQLQSEKSKLEEMQESARHAGFGSAVYDP